MRATQRLSARGFEAYLVGGCVRDLLLGRAPKDYDIATGARPQQVKRTFPRNCRIIGRRFKLAHLHFHDNTKILEVSTFRRSPQENGGGDEDLLITRDNEFGTAEEDALRRDFTVNALFLDPTRDLILDYTNGLADLRARVIRTIGDPRVRFREDPVRILRAAKFAGRLGFEIEPETFAAMAETSSDLVRAAPPRLLEEVLRLLRGGHALDSFQLLRDVGALRSLLPVLAEFLATARHDQRVAFWRLLEALDHRIAETGHVPQNAVLLGVLLVGPVLAQVELNPGRSPSSVAEDLLGPLGQALRLPRRDAGCLKRICGVQHRFGQTDETKRFRIAGFVHGPYFDEALELFELRVLGQGEGEDIVRRWREIAASMGRGGAVDTDFHEHDEAPEVEVDPAEVDGDEGALETEAEGGEAETGADEAPREEEAGADAAPADSDDDSHHDAQPPAGRAPAGGEGADADAGSGEGGRRRRRRRGRRGRRGRGPMGADGNPADASGEPFAPADGRETDPDHPATDDGSPVARGSSPRRADDAPAIPSRRQPAREADFVHPEGAGPAPRGRDADAVEPDESALRPWSRGDADTAADAEADGENGENDGASAPGATADPDRRRRRRRRRRRGRRDDATFPASPPPAPHGEALDAEGAPHEPPAIRERRRDPEAPLPEADDEPLPQDLDADAGPEADDGAADGMDDAGIELATVDEPTDGADDGAVDADDDGALDGDGEPEDGTPAEDGGAAGVAAPAGEGRRRRRRRGRRGRRRGGDDAANGPAAQQPAGRPPQKPNPPQQQRQQHQQHQQHQHGSQGSRRERHERRRGGHGSPRDVDIVPRHRDRRGKVDVIEPPPLDLSAFDVELDPKRVPTFGSIVEGKGRPKKRSPRVPDDGVDDYKPPPPPGADAPPAPPPPPADDRPDTFGDW